MSFYVFRACSILVVPIKSVYFQIDMLCQVLFSFTISFPSDPYVWLMLCTVTFPLSYKMNSVLSSPQTFQAFTYVRRFIEATNLITVELSNFPCNYCGTSQLKRLLIAFQPLIYPQLLF